MWITIANGSFLPVQIKLDVSNRPGIAPSPESLSLFPSRNSNGKNEEFDYTLSHRIIWKRERRVGFDQWVFYLVGDFWILNDSNRPTSETTRTEIKQDADVVSSNLYVGKKKEKKRERNIIPFSFFVRWGYLCDCSLSLCAASIIHFCLESARDGPENLFLLLLSSVCMTFIYQRFTMGPLSVQLEEEKGETFVFADAFCSDSIADAHRNMHHQFPVCLILSLSLSIFISRDILSLSISFFLLIL